MPLPNPFSSNNANAVSSSSSSSAATTSTNAAHHRELMKMNNVVSGAASTIVAAAPSTQQLPPHVTNSTAMSMNLGSIHHFQSQQQQQQQQQMYNPSNFVEVYDHLCAVLNQVPLQVVKSSLVANEAGPTLDLNADRLKSLDWDPLLGALKINRNLNSIHIQSKYLLSGEGDQSDSIGRSSRGVNSRSGSKKIPAIRVKDRANKLCRAIRDCLSVTACLANIEIFNIPLTPKDCAQIAKGLRSNKTLKSLSLDSCLIGDDGLAVICKDLQNLSNINRINFSSCLLTHEGANILATLIKVQALKRHYEASKRGEVRYGRPDLDSMFGIRRITINSNPSIGDRGVQALVDAFKSDLWVKALDLQDCGITTQGANYLLDGLKFNAVIKVLDVRLNPSIDRETLHKIMELVMINSTDNSNEYEWIELIQRPVAIQHPPVQPQQQHHQQQQQQQASGSLATMSSSGAAPVSGAAHRRAVPNGKRLKKRRTTNASFSHKHSITSSLRFKRSKSTGSVTLNKSGVAASAPNGSACGGGSSGGHHSTVRRSHTNYNCGAQWKLASRSRAMRANRNSPAADPDFVDEEDEFEDEDEVLEEFGETNQMVKSENRMPQLGPHGDDDVDETHYNHHHHHRPYHNQYHMPPNSGGGAAVSGGGAGNAMIVNSTLDYGRLNSIGLSSKRDPTGRQQQQQQQQQQQMRKSSNECLVINKSDLVSNLDKMKNSSVKDLLVILQKQIDSKAQLEEMLLMLQDQNTNLQMEISSLKSENVALKCKLDDQQKIITRMSSSSSSSTSANAIATTSNELSLMHHDADTTQLNRTATNLEEEKALEIIELTLLKYQNFLDFLRNFGFGKLIELAECNQQRQEQLKNTATHHQLQKQLSQLTSQQPSLSQDSNVSKSTINCSMTGGSQDDYELAYLAAKLLMRTDRARGVNESVISADLKNLANDLKLDFSNSLYMNETSIGGGDSIMPNFDADGETTLGVDTLISNALELSRSYRRMNSSSVNSTFNLLSNLNMRGTDGAGLNRVGSTGGIKKNLLPLTDDLDETNKENMTTIDQSTLLNNDQDLAT